MNFTEAVLAELQRLDEGNLTKYETVLGKSAVMLASNNYLGLSNHPAVCKAAIDGIRTYGYGLASVRFLT